jgi:hypothetical protein
MVGVLACCLLSAACGEADVGESAPTSKRPANGKPDCGGDQPWVAEPGIDPDAPGDPTAEAALRPFLEQWRGTFGGDVVMVGDDRAALVVDGGEVVVAYTMRTNPGGFAVNGSTGCDGYEPDVRPGPPSPGDPYPHTAPLVSSLSSSVESSGTTNTTSTTSPAPSMTAAAAPVPRLDAPAILEKDLLDEPAPRLDPPPPELDPAMSADEVVERFRPHLEATSARPASRLLVRFALYSGIDWTIEDAKTQPPTVTMLPVWVVVADGLLIIPNCPAPSIPSKTEHCAPIPGHGMIIAADNDGHEIISE